MNNQIPNHCGDMPTQLHFSAPEGMQCQLSYKNCPFPIRNGSDLSEALRAAGIRLELIPSYSPPRLIEGFRRLNQGENWLHGPNPKAKLETGDLEGGYRPLLIGEKLKEGDETLHDNHFGWMEMGPLGGNNKPLNDRKYRTKRPLPRTPMIPDKVNKHRRLKSNEKWVRVTSGPDWWEEDFEGGWRPLIVGESIQLGDEFFAPSGRWRAYGDSSLEVKMRAMDGWKKRTRRPLPALYTPLSYKYFKGEKICPIVRQRSDRTIMYRVMKMDQVGFTLHMGKRGLRILVEYDDLAKYWEFSFGNSGVTEDGRQIWHPFYEV